MSATTGAVLLYDGDCGFCTKSVAWLDQRNLLGFPARPWQSVPDHELPASPEALMTEVVLTRPGRRPLGGADAIAACVRESPSRLRFAGRLLALPGLRGLARAVYRLVARNRYRLPGSTAACRIERPG
ncbi:Predicted thiol-disulfide oxidoreductase YuxK, DCC family [Amycolatopsis arida]|uniref:Predicted thiol-disulfide oxidoreductase YuxK, DCC family n=1 Tax=Amycolatopsis arida TaxID=587909 RepID=A0A1I5YFK9_9PSEU|nr:DUF393 domain-containing protein [Amycolatopsis arida]TDX90480.1 putative DCC family thiol-disulfide oxidoreductase YuxK [Amycolatopsis arida]SFQ42994.1 Predicted thiol-disulfide oxidoreductase YuxK, DCC family [Amycolatopsis arida]